MTWGQPLALALLALAVPVALAFLDRRRARARTVSSVQLYRKLVGGAASAAPRWRLRDLLALALVLLALAGVALALARPGVGGERRTVVVVLDTSASMGAVASTGETRLSLGLDALRDHLRGLSDGDRAALVTAGPAASLDVAPTEDVGAVLAAARAVTPAGGSDGDAAAMRLATALCRDPASTSILVVSDGLGAAASEGACPVQRLVVGEAADNAGLTAFTARATDRLGEVEVHLAVESEARAARGARVLLHEGDRLLHALSLDLPAEGRVERVVRVTADETVSATLSVDGPDALAVDDRAFAVLGGSAPVRALLVTDRERSFLADALSLHPGVSLVVAPPDAVPDETYDLAVLEAEPTELPRARTRVAFGTDPARHGVPDRGTVVAPGAPTAAVDDPLLRFVALDEVTLTKTRLLGLPEGATAFARVDDGPIGVRVPGDDGGTVVLGFAPDDTDLVLRIGFVNLVANLVDGAAAGTPTSRPHAVPLGDVLVGITNDAVVRDPDGARVPPGAPLVRPGIYTVEDAGEVRRVAVSLLSSDESRLSPERAAAPVPPPTPTASWWRLLVLVALFAMALEWLLPALRRALRPRLPPRIAS